jgi:6-phosphogluconolactonase
MTVDHSHDVAEWAQSFALLMCRLLSGCIESKGRAVLAVSGGSSPTPCLAKLSEADLDWAKVTVLPVDERWVPVSSPQSNERLIRSTLLQNRAASARFLSLYCDAPTPAEGEATIERRLQAIAPGPDFAVLGMGLDGHTASWFPGTPELERCLRTSQLCCASSATAEPAQRMTLSLHALLQAQQLVLLYAGADKHAVFDRATDAVDASAMPVRAILHQDAVPVAVLSCY